MSNYLKFNTAITGTDAERAKFPVRSPDPAFRTKLTTDWCVDATTAVGFQTGSLPADTANIGTLVNVANDSPPALPVGIRGAVTALINLGAVTMTNGGAAGTRGITRNGEGTSNGVKVVKAALGANAIGHPPTEGFLDFLVIAWCKPTALNTWSLLGCSNNNSGSNQFKFWGIDCSAAGNFRESLSLRTLTGAAAGAWSQVAVHYRFDTSGGAIYVRTFVNGVEVNAASAGTAISTTPANMTAAGNTATRTLIGSNFIDVCFKGIIGRVERIFTAQSGNTLDPLLLVQQDYAANRLLVTGA